MISEEYAKALYSMLDTIKDKELMLNELTSFHASLTDEDIKYFAYPFINKSLKKEIINKALVKNLMRDFLNVLIDNDRFNMLFEIIESYKSLLLEEKELSKIKVYSNKSLSEEYLNKLKEKMSNKLKRECVVENIIDESIKAGIRISYDSKEIDLTVDNKINNMLSLLKEQL